MPYNEGDIIDYPDGTVRQLKGGNWDLIETKAPDSDFSATGLAKAVGSGALHEGVPAVGGMIGDVRDLANSGAAWLGNKITGSDKFTPEGLNDTAKELGGITGAIARAPNSNDIKSKITPVVPEYTPQNMWERGGKSVGGFLPGAALAPEMAAPSVGRVGAAIGRYALAPGLASQGVRELPDSVVGDYREPAAMAAALIAPGVTGKLISPNPADAGRRAAAEALSNRGATFTPKQLSGGDLTKEGNALNFPGTGGNPSAINARNTDNFTSGVMQHFEDANIPGIGPDVTRANSITPAVREKLNAGINNEFTRLTGGQPMPFDHALGNDLSTAVKDFASSAKMTHSNRPVEMVREMITEARNNGGAFPVRSYQDWRSELSSAANAEGASPATTRVYSKMRDALDSAMERHVAAVHPNDVGAFPRLRNAYENKLTVDKMMGAVGDSAAGYKATPDTLASASRSVLGPDRFSMESTPMARYARSGQQILGKEVPNNTTGLLHDWRLASILAGGAGFTGHSAGELLAGGSHGSGLGTIIGAVGASAPAARDFMRGRLMNTPGGERYLSNQILGSEFRPKATQNPANAALMAELLARKKAQDETAQ